MNKRTRENEEESVNKKPKTFTSSPGIEPIPELITRKKIEPKILSSSIGVDPPTVLSKDNIAGPNSPQLKPKQFSSLVTEDEGADWALFVSFSNNAHPGELSPEKFPLPTPELSYNDDVELPLYESALRSYAGTQKKGIRDEHPSAKTVDEHVKAALSAPFFLAQKTPLPESLERSIQFLGKSNLAAVRQFWTKQIQRLKSIAAKHKCLSDQWLEARPQVLKPLKGVNTLLLAFLMDRYGLKGQKWVKQLIFGFPIVGSLSQKGVYPIDEKEHKVLLTPNELTSSAFARFRERATAANPPRFEELWSEALEQVQKGWLTKPIHIPENEGELLWKSKDFNLAFRFSVQQGEKNRACDDLRHSRTNDACMVLTPIRLISWDHVSEMTNQFRALGKFCEFFKCDHRSAYKALPVDPSHTKLAVIVLKNPKDGLFYAFTSNTLLFGSIASVLHYNVFARIITELVNRIFGIPMISFFDDFGGMTPPELTLDAVTIFGEFAKTVIFELKDKKTKFGKRVDFLGLSGEFPARSNKGTLSICLTREKATNWRALIVDFLKEGRISHQALESIIGKLGFSQSAMFGKFARSQMRVLYKKQHRKIYCAILSEQEKAVLNWWCAVLTELKPRVARQIVHTPDFVIYSDAASTHVRIAAILFKGGSTGPPIIELLVKGRTPLFWIRMFHSTNLIYGLELLALLAFIYMNRFVLRNKSVNIYIDNNNALCALIRGDSNTAVIADMSACFWRLCQSFGIDVWLGRVGSKLNIADHPTREESSLPFKVVKTSDYKNLFKLSQIVQRAHIFKFLKSDFL